MWKKLTLFGMIGAIIYVLHVVIGGFLWKGYNHLMQPISDLTAAGAPDKALLSIFTLIYGICSIIFAICSIAYVRGFVPGIAKAGLVVFLAMHIVSITYGLFPEDLPGSGVTFTGTMHIVVTILIVPLTILAPFLVGFGLKKVEGFKGFGIYSIVTGIIIFIAGGTSAMFFAQHLPYFGLVERINIGTLQLWMFLLSLKLFRGKSFESSAEVTEVLSE